jgi:hypothetical protein
VFTTGLNTCIFVVVQTEGPTLAWHARLSSPETMSRLRSQFKKVGHSGKSGFGGLRLSTSRQGGGPTTATEKAQD